MISDSAAPQNYTGVQDFDDYLEGPTPQFYDPDSPAGPFGDWPLYPGLMDRAQQPFQAAGLTVPSYVSVGNHDGLVQGNAAANAALRVGRDRLRQADVAGGNRPADARRRARAR